MPFFFKYKNIIFFISTLAYKYCALSTTFIRSFVHKSSTTLTLHNFDLLLHRHALFLVEQEVSILSDFMCG